MPRGGFPDKIVMEDTLQNNILAQMKDTGLVPVFNHSDIEIAKKVLDACYAGGVRVFEFTNRSANAPTVFEQLQKHSEQYQDLVLGIGTVFNVQMSKVFIDLGTSFIVSPAMIPEMGAYCLERQVPWIPGCGTVTEIFHAKEAGATMVKIFPGNVLGAGFVKSAKAVFPELAIMPTGGVAPTEDNLKAWFDAGVICVGMGSKLISKEALSNQDYSSIKQLVGEVISTISSLRQ